VLSNDTTLMEIQSGRTVPLTAEFRVIENVGATNISLILNSLTYRILNSRICKFLANKHGDKYLDTVSHGTPVPTRLTFQCGTFLRILHVFSLST
jgi:hypothetical protein